MISKRKIITFTLVVLAFALFVAAPHLVRVKKILCRSQYGSCSNDLSEGLKPFEGRSLSESKKRTINYLGKEPLVRDYNLQFKLPDTLEVSVLERKAKFSISNSDKSLYVISDSMGKILESSKSTELPNLIIDGKLPEKGRVLDQNTLFALNLLYDMNTSYQVKEGKEESGSLLIELPGNLRVIFPLEGDREALVGGLTLLYNEMQKGNSSKFDNMETKISTIDMRYKNPILK